MDETKLAVSEIFGPTIQGEGPYLGHPTMFLRLGGCNQHCVFCDTPYTWDWVGRNGTKYDPNVELVQMTVGVVIDQILLKGQGKVNHLVISGGEPLLQQDALRSLCIHFREVENWFVEIETAGSIPLRHFLADQYNVSIKLRSSGNDDKVRINPEAIESFKGHYTAWKFVVSSIEDLDEIDYLREKYHFGSSVLERPRNKIYLMPLGIDTGTINESLQNITEEAIKRGYILTTRLQILIHGNKRGV